jgi:hypothetical protein
LKYFDGIIPFDEKNAPITIFIPKDRRFPHVDFIFHVGAERVEEKFYFV